MKDDSIILHLKLPRKYQSAFYIICLSTMLVTSSICASYVYIVTDIKINVK